MMTPISRNISIDSVSFQENINKFENKAKEISECIDAIDKNMVQIDGTNEIWKSETALLMHDDYVEVKKHLDAINTELADYLSFLKKTLASYQAEEESINRLMEDNDSYLDVNE